DPDIGFGSQTDKTQGSPATQAGRQARGNTRSGRADPGSRTAPQGYRSRLRNPAHQRVHHAAEYPGDSGREKGEWQALRGTCDRVRRPGEGTAAESPKAAPTGVHLDRMGQPGPPKPEHAGEILRGRSHLAFRRPGAGVEGQRGGSAVAEETG